MSRIGKKRPRQDCPRCGRSVSVNVRMGPRYHMCPHGKACIDTVFGGCAECAKGRTA